MSLDTPFTETTDQPIVIRHSRGKLLLMSLGSLAFVLGGLWMMSSAQNSTVYYEGLAALIFFGLCLLVFLFQIFTSSLLLTIDDEEYTVFILSGVPSLSDGKRSTASIQSNCASSLFLR